MQAQKSAASSFFDHRAATQQRLQYNLVCSLFIHVMSGFSWRYLVEESWEQLGEETASSTLGWRERETETDPFCQRMSQQSYPSLHFQSLTLALLSSLFSFPLLYLYLFPTLYLCQHLLHPHCSHHVIISSSIKCLLFFQWSIRVRTVSIYITCMSMCVFRLHHARRFLRMVLVWLHLKESR